MRSGLPTYDEVVMDGARVVSLAIIAIFAACIFGILVWHYGRWTDQQRANDMARHPQTTLIIEGR